MSEFGLKTWDKTGRVTYDSTDYTMRIVATVQLRLGPLSGTRVIPCAPARAGMKAVVSCMPNLYTDWGNYFGQVKCRASLPAVQVVDGALVLSASSGANYSANLDVILVIA